MFQFIILSLFFCAVFTFISDNFKFSNNKFIFLLQKIISYSLICALIVLVGCMLYLVGVNISNLGSIFCDSDDEAGGDSDTENDENSNKSKKEKDEGTVDSKDEDVESSNNKEKDVVRVTENTKNDTYSFEINKKIVDNAIDKGPEIVMEGIKDVAPKLGVAAAAGKAASEAIKHTGGMSPLPRALSVGGAALVTAVGTTVGLELGKALT